MAMDEKTRELMGQLKGRLVNTADGQITEIIKEARDEALAEAKAIIKGIMVQTILEDALRELEGVGGIVAPARETIALAAATGVAPANERPSLTAQARTSTTLRQDSGELSRAAQDVAENNDQIREEIEAIRRKIAENERLLSQVKASPTKTEEGPEPPVEPVLSPALSVVKGEAEGPVLSPALSVVEGEAEGDEVSAPRKEGEEGYGYYVYGVVGGDSSQPVEGLPEKGIDPVHPVYALQPSAISHRLSAISAIVSRVSLQEFGQEELETNLDDIRWLEAKVRSHQGVLETVMANHTLVPMRFCTIYRSESRVQEMLGQHYDDFVEALAQLEGKQEWGVKAYCDGKTLAQRVGEVSDRVKELRAEVEQKSSGAAYFLKKKMDETIAEEVQRISDEYAQRSHDRLSRQAEEAVVNPLQNKEITGRKEEMILNGAYLVLEEQLPVFRAELENLEEEYDGLGFDYEMTGPWPPYNFVTISFEEGVTDESVGG
jgi:hypothetical protein